MMNHLERDLESLERELLFQAAIDMVRTSLDAFVNVNVDQARSVVAADDDVDELNREWIGELSTMMQADPRIVDAAMLFFSASRHVERIADHATNIAEYVINLGEGEIARHKHGEIISTYS